ncbi:MAG: hypothetical protein JSU92_06860 [Deltaproteobacteria bacterium]|nr:MAG: hypothetical protein JSU92_06860 [Deltaproteobacteria bacterium]
MATNIIGRGLSGVLKYTKTKAGEDGLKEILHKLSEEDRAIFSDKINPAGWYPFKTYVNLLIIVDKELGNGDLSLCKDMGQWSAEKDLEAVYKIFTDDTFKDLNILKTAPHVMWQGYYDQGNMVFPELPKTDYIESIKARIVDFPDAAKPSCRLLEGWIEKAVNIISGNRIRGIVTEVKCRIDGHEYCEYLWETKYAV